MEWFLVTMAYGCGFFLVVAATMLVAWLITLCWKPLAFLLLIFIMGWAIRQSPETEDARQKAHKAPVMQGTHTNIAK